MTDTITLPRSVVSGALHALDLSQGLLASARSIHHITVLEEYKSLRAALSQRATVVADDVLTDEQCDQLAEQAMDQVAAARGMHTDDLNPDIQAHHTLRRALIRAGAAQGITAPRVAQQAEPAIKFRHGCQWCGKQNCTTHQQVAQQAERGWQPIESAPKDRTVVLLLRRKEVTAGAFHAELGKFPWLIIEESRDGINGLEDSIRHGPTHWMPLPSSPKEIK